MSFLTFHRHKTKDKIWNLNLFWNSAISYKGLYLIYIVINKYLHAANFVFKAILKIIIRQEQGDVLCFSSEFLQQTESWQTSIRIIDKIGHSSRSSSIQRSKTTEVSVNVKQF